MPSIPFYKHEHHKVPCIPNPCNDFHHHNHSLKSLCDVCIKDPECGEILMYCDDKCWTNDKNKSLKVRMCGDVNEENYDNVVEYINKYIDARNTDGCNISLLLDCTLEDRNLECEEFNKAIDACCSDGKGGKGRGRDDVSAESEDCTNCAVGEPCRRGEQVGKKDHPCLIAEPGICNNCDVIETLGSAPSIRIGEKISTWPTDTFNAIGTVTVGADIGTGSFDPTPSQDSYSVLVGSLNISHFQNKYSVVVGTHNLIATHCENNCAGADSGCIGAQGKQSVIVGSLNNCVVQGSNSVTIGTENVSSQYDNAVTIGYKNVKDCRGSQEKNSVIIGYNNILQGQGSDSICIGSSNAFFQTTKNIIMGTNVATVKGQETSCNIAIGCDTAFNGQISGSSILQSTIDCLNMPNIPSGSNIGIGDKAVYSGQSGGANISMGYQTAYSGQNGNANMAFGLNAVKSNPQSGYSHIAFGTNSVYEGQTGSANIAFGTDAVYGGQEGDGNIAFGLCVAKKGQGGDCNIALGCEAISNSDNYTDYNIAIGYRAANDGQKASITLCATTDSSGGHVAIGCKAANNGQKGYSHIALGTNAVRDGAQDGIGNIAIGLDSAIKGQNTVCDNTIYTNCINNKCDCQPKFKDICGSHIAFGYKAAHDGQKGGGNMALGHRAAFDGQCGDCNIAIGCEAAKEQQIGECNIAIGCNAAYGGQTGKLIITDPCSDICGSPSTECLNVCGGHIAFGCDAAHDKQEGECNMAFGCGAAKKGQIGRSNISLGSEAAHDGQCGDCNIAIGCKAAEENQCGDCHIALGCDAAHDGQKGESNIAFGHNAAKKGQSGNNNIAFGHNASSNGQAGSSSITIGFNAGFDQRDSSIAIGDRAASGAIQFDRNIAIGRKAGGDVGTVGQTDICNVAIGDECCVSGQFALNTAVGCSVNALSGVPMVYANTAVGAGAYANWIGCTSLGFGATAWGLGCTSIGALSVDILPFFSSTLGSPLTALFSTIWLWGWLVIASDERDKQNIIDNRAGLEFINKLRTVEYESAPRELEMYGDKSKLDDMLKDENIEKLPDDVKSTVRSKLAAPRKKRLGLLAGQVKAVCIESGIVPDMVEETSKVNKAGVTEESMGLSYIELIAPLIKAVQELSAENKILADKNKALDDRITALGG